MNIKKEDITASFVAEQLPEVANTLRAEGAKTVNADELVAKAVKAEQETAKAQIAAAKVEGATEERKRIASLKEVAMAGSEELLAKAIDEGTSAEKFAMDQALFLKKNAGKNSAQAALESAEAVASKVGVDPLTGSPKKLTPAEQAKADAEVLKAKGII